MHFLIFLIAIVIPVGCQINFRGHKVLGLLARNETELNFLKTLTKHSELDFWTPPASLNQMVYIQAPPRFSELEMQLRSKGISFNVLTNDLQKWIDEERVNNPPDTALAGSQREFRLDLYHTYEAINSYTDTVGTRYATIASVQNIGTTYEGNAINGLKIGSADSNKPAIWIEAGIHAREWMSPATAIYIIDQLVTGYDTDPEIKHLVDTFDWYIFPVVNPDGYNYTWTNNRLWRKNRNHSSSSTVCIGVDANRNFDSAFGGGGSNENVCSDAYPGSEAFSEAETRAIRDGVLKVGDRLKAYFSLHAYGQMWMSPYAYSTKNPPHYKEHMKALRDAVSAIQSTHGKVYKYGTIANIIYRAYGSSIDWVYDAVKVKYSIAIEMRDTGNQGFFASNTEIVPNAKENFKGIKAVVKIIESEL